MKKKLFAGIAFSAVCMYFALRGVSWGEMAHALKAAKLQWLGVAVMVYTAGYMARAIRWSYLLKALDAKASPSAVFGPLMIGFMANNFLPLRMGEVVRAHVVARKLGLSTSACIGTVAIERLLDLFCFVSIFAFAALSFPFPAGIKRGAMVMALTGIVGTVALAVLIAQTERIKLFLERPQFRLIGRGRFADVFWRFILGLKGVINRKTLLAASMPSAFAWFMEIVFIYCLAQALAVPLSLAGSVFLILFIGLAVTLPQAPGYVGTVELFGLAALSLLGHSKEKALPLMLAIHGAQFLYIGVLGFYAMSREGLSLSGLRHLPRD